MEFGSGRSAGRRWVPRALLAGLVLAAVAVVAVRGAGHQAQRAARAPASAPAPPMHVTIVGHSLLGVTAGWELFARGPDDLLRIQLAQGRITQMAATGGRLVAIDPRTGRAEGLGVNLPAVDQVAIRP